MIEKNGACIIDKESEIKRDCFAKQDMYLCVYMDSYLNGNSNPLPSHVKSLLHKFDDVFPKGVPSGLHPLRRTEHQMDIIMGETFAQ